MELLSQLTLTATEYNCGVSHTILLWMKCLLNLLKLVSLKWKIILISEQIKKGCFTYLKARPKPSSTFFPQRMTNTASCTRSMLDPNNVGTEDDETLVSRIPLDCKGWSNSGIKSITWRCSSSQLCKNFVTSICRKMVLKWWLTSLGSSFIANCNVLSTFLAETVHENTDYRNQMLQTSLLHNVICSHS